MWIACVWAALLCCIWVCLLLALWLLMLWCFVCFDWCGWVLVIVWMFGWLFIVCLFMFVVFGYLGDGVIVCVFILIWCLIWDVFCLALFRFVVFLVFGFCWIVGLCMLYWLVVVLLFVIVVGTCCFKCWFSLFFALWCLMICFLFLIILRWDAAGWFAFDCIGCFIKMFVGLRCWIRFVSLIVVDVIWFCLDWLMTCGLVDCLCFVALINSVVVFVRYFRWFAYGEFCVISFRLFDCIDWWLCFLMIACCWFVFCVL